MLFCVGVAAIPAYLLRRPLLLLACWLPGVRFMFDLSAAGTTGTSYWTNSFLIRILSDLSVHVRSRYMLNSLAAALRIMFINYLHDRDSNEGHHLTLLVRLLGLNSCDEDFGGVG